MEVVPLVALGTLVFTFVNLLKAARARNLNAVLTQAIVWAAGIAAVFLVGATQLGNLLSITFGSGPAAKVVNLAVLTFWSKVLVGLLASSLLSTFNEAKKAVDSNDSAATPPLFPKLHAKQVVPPAAISAVPPPAPTV